MNDWLLVGALSVEVLPVWRRLRARRRLGEGLWTGRLAGRRVALLRAGVGPDRAEARTRAALSRVDAQRVLSFGTCGAIADHLRVGDVLSVEHVVGHGPVQALRGHPVATLATVRDPVWTPAQRREHADRGVHVVEMEAAAVARAASERPFHAIKIVSDLAGAHPDGALTPSPWRILRFRARALRLCERRLAPALVRALSS